MNDIQLAEEMRAFNRFYTELIGSLDDHHEGSELTLAQARMLYTVDALKHPEIGELAAALRLDLAYTSRVLGSLEDSGLIERSVSPDDRRRRRAELTQAGARSLDQIKARSNDRMIRLIAHLDQPAIRDLLAAMSTIRHLLDDDR